MEIMIYRWKETNGGKGGPGSRQNMLDMKMLKTKMLETKVLNENKGDSEQEKVFQMWP